MVWGKTDIIKYLAELRGYRSYLEICTATTGKEFSKVDQSQFDLCHRLMYRCPDNFADGLHIDFKASDLDITQCIAEINRGNFRYDIILVDPWHEYEHSYRDMKEALSLLNDNGSIVVHDCLPPTEGMISPSRAGGSWCGVTFMAYVDFVTERPDIGYRTIDTDFGCGVIQKGSDSLNHRPPLALLKSWKELSNNANAAFHFMQDNKQSLLQLIPIDEFVRTATGSLVNRKQHGIEEAATWLQAKQRLAVGPWHAAAGGQVALLRGDGWSTVEKWGVWGVGPSHTISVVPDNPPLSDFDIDFDVHAPVLPARPTLDVDVLVSGQPTTVWHFNEARNRHVRSVKVRRAASVPVETPATVELRPRSVLSPSELDHSQKDTRPLGVGLHALRLRSLHVRTGAWHSAAGDGLALLLGEGWFKAEAWGLWGIGPVHSISMVPIDPQLSDFDVDLDVHAAIMLARPTLEVDVLVSGQPATVWHFSELLNRGVRSVGVHRAASVAAPTPVEIELRPRSVVSPRELDPSQADARPLGVALHRLRICTPER